MLAAGLGWRDGSPAAPSYDQGTPEEAVATIELLLVARPRHQRDEHQRRHRAARGRHCPRVTGDREGLVERGANLNVPNKRGQTPLAIAQRSNKDMTRIVPILQAAGAQAPPPGTPPPATPAQAPVAPPAR